MAGTGPRSRLNPPPGPGRTSGGLYQSAASPFEIIYSRRWRGQPASVDHTHGSPRRGQAGPWDPERQGHVRTCSCSVTTAGDGDQGSLAPQGMGEGHPYHLPECTCEQLCPKPRRPPPAHAAACSVPSQDHLAHRRETPRLPSGPCLGAAPSLPNSKSPRSRAPASEGPAGPTRKQTLLGTPVQLQNPQNFSLRVYLMPQHRDQGPSLCGYAVLQPS